MKFLVKRDHSEPDVIYDDHKKHPITPPPPLKPDLYPSTEEGSVVAALFWFLIRLALTGGALWVLFIYYLKPKRREEQEEYQRVEELREEVN